MPQCLPQSLYSVTRGWLDTRYRDGLDKQKLLKPNVPFSATVVENPQDYVFKKGHHIGLNFSTEILEWSLPKPYPCFLATDPVACLNVKVNWIDGGTSVTLPVVNAPKDPSDLFDFGHSH
jgi:predicted acyl esterase